MINQISCTKAICTYCGSANLYSALECRKCGGSLRYSEMPDVLPIQTGNSGTGDPIIEDGCTRQIVDYWIPIILSRGYKGFFHLPRYGILKLVHLVFPAFVGRRSPEYQITLDVNNTVIAALQCVTEREIKISQNYFLQNTQLNAQLIINVSETWAEGMQEKILCRLHRDIAVNGEYGNYLKKLS